MEPAFGPATFVLCVGQGIRGGVVGSGGGGFGGCIPMETV